MVGRHMANRTKKLRSYLGYLSEKARKDCDESDGRKVRFQKSHAERRGESETWQWDEWGNHLIDQVAGTAYLEDAESVANHRFVGEEVDLVEVLRQMIPEGQ